MSRLGAILLAMIVIGAFASGILTDVPDKASNPDIEVAYRLWGGGQ